METCETPTADGLPPEKLCRPSADGDGGIDIGSRDLSRGISVGRGLLERGVSNADVSRILEKREDGDDAHDTLLTMYGGGTRKDQLRFSSGTGIQGASRSHGNKGWKAGGRVNWGADESDMMILKATGSGQHAVSGGSGGEGERGVGRTALDAIVTSFLRNQHERCPDPVCVLPPLSLSEPHRCPARTPAGAVGAGAPPSVAKRALAQQVRGWVGVRVCWWLVLVLVCNCAIF